MSPVGVSISILHKLVMSTKVTVSTVLGFKLLSDVLLMNSFAESFICTCLVTDLNRATCTDSPG